MYIATKNSGRTRLVAEDIATTTETIRRLSTDEYPADNSINHKIETYRLDTQAYL